MNIDDLINALKEARKRYGGETEVAVHCHGCCPHANEIESMAIGERDDEKHMLVIQV